MPNRREFDHIGSYNFRVEIDGVTVGAFQEVSGLEVVTEVVEFQDGADLRRRKRPGRTSFSNIVLKTRLHRKRRAVDLDVDRDRRQGRKEGRLHHPAWRRRCR